MLYTCVCDQLLQNTLPQKFFTTDCSTDVTDLFAEQQSIFLCVCVCCQLSVHNCRAGPHNKQTVSTNCKSNGVSFAASLKLLTRVLSQHASVQKVYCRIALTVPQTSPHRTTASRIVSPIKRVTPHNEHADALQHG